MKGGVKGVLFVGLLLISFVSIVSAESCEIKLGEDVFEEGNIILETSDLTNAHASVFSGTIDTSKYYLACDFTADRTCDGTNYILSLSSDSNAHIDFTGEYYSVEVCFGDLSCSLSADSCPTEYGIPVASLSSASGTNAHIGNFDSYTTKLCCTHNIVAPVCGNGAQQEGEECDDGNTNDGDGCNSDCQFEFCGDGIITLTDSNGYYDDSSGSSVPESCDPLDDNECSSTCTSANLYWARSAQATTQMVPLTANIADTIYMKFTDTFAPDKCFFKLSTHFCKSLDFSET